MKFEVFAKFPASGYQTLTPEGWSSWAASKQSMTRFATFLTSRLQQPVRDITGLPGVYDFTVIWAPQQAPTASSDGSGPTMFEAVQKLGLKLVPAKESVTMIVIDHAEKMPTENQYALFLGKPSCGAGDIAGSLRFAGLRLKSP